MNRRQFIAAMLAAGAAIALPPGDDDAEVPSAVVVDDDRFLVEVGVFTPRRCPAVIYVRSGSERIWAAPSMGGVWTRHDLVMHFANMPKVVGPLNIEGPPGTLAVLTLARDSGRGGFQTFDHVVEALRSLEQVLLAIPGAP